MNNCITDLHIHSTFSDGTLTPARIVAAAKARGVGAIAVCDHNVTAGSLETERLAREAGLRCVPGCEVDVMLLGEDAHILCYGADFDHPQLRALILDARARLDEMSDELLRRMLPEYPSLSWDEYDVLAHDSDQGGWKLLQYLKAKGVTHALKDALPLYDRYGVGYNDAGFRPADEVIAAIHDAGGCAVLAHPGVTFPTRTMEAVEAACALGADGVECHYHRHSRDLTLALTDHCRRRGLQITVGSDCHGAFGHTEIGHTRTPMSALCLTHPAFGPLTNKY